nr:hypothetical protein [Cronobacter sakazakii]
MSQLSFESLFLADQTEPQPRVSAPVRVLSPAEARKQFASVFRQTARYMHRSEVFLAASGLDMARIHTPENIENSRRICERYQPDDLDAMRHLFCLLVEGLAGEMHDFLGALYMEHELGADEMGQYFSPSSISRLLAGLLMPGAQETIKRVGGDDAR